MKLPLFALRAGSLLALAALAAFGQCTGLSAVAQC